MSDPTRRYLVSGSAMDRAAKCSGSVAMEKEVVSSGRFVALPDPARDSGLRIHAYLADISNGELTTDIALSPDDELTAGHCIKLRDAALSAWQGTEPATNGNKEILVEKRFWYRRGVVPLFSAQLDYAQIDHAKRRAFIVDYKTGRLEADEASDNLQLRTEVVVLKHNYPDLEEISATIIEPFVSWDATFVRYAGDDLRQAENQIVAIADRTIWEADKRVAGPWCKYCKARTHCLAAVRYAQGVPAIDREKAFFELPRGEAGAALWERIGIAEKLLEGIKWAYTRILETEPDALPGYVLPERGRPRRRVPFPRKLKDALAEYLTDDETDGCASYQLSKIEELIGIKHRLEKTEAKRLVEKLTREVVMIDYDTPFIRAMTRKEKEK